MGLKEELALGDSVKFVVCVGDDEHYIRHPETMECTNSEIKAHDFKTIRRAKLYKNKLLKKGIEAHVEAIDWECF